MDILLFDVALNLFDEVVPAWAVDENFCELWGLPDDLDAGSDEVEVEGLALVWGGDDVLFADGDVGGVLGVVTAGVCEFFGLGLEF